MKSLILSILLVFIAVFTFSQNKPNVAIVSTFDDRMTHYHYGLTIITNYINYYNLDFDCNEYMIDYIKKKLSYKYNFVELPTGIPVMGIKEKFNSYEVSKKSLYLLDTLKNHSIDLVIRIQNWQGSVAGILPFTGWGIHTYRGSSFVYACFKLTILNVGQAKFGPEIWFDPEEDTIGVAEIKAKSKKEILLTPEELSFVPDPIMQITSKILDRILPKW